MKIISKHYKIWLLICMVSLFAACSGDDPIIDDPVAISTITSISPTSGPKTTIVTINGNDFRTEAGSISVFFNGVEADVQSVEDDKIVAIVPARAFTGLVTVVKDGNTITGPEFNYLISDVQVSTLAGSVQGDFNSFEVCFCLFDSPTDVAVDQQGNVYVADFENHKIKKITPAGVISTLAGSTEGFSDGTGSSAQFNSPHGVAVDAQGNVYVTDRDNHRIRKITPAGVVSTLAGSLPGFANGAGASAKFDTPRGVAVDAQGNVFVTDSGHKIRKITPDGFVSTFAGSTLGFANGSGENAQFTFPQGVAVDDQGNVYVGDNNTMIRKITSDGVVSTLPGIFFNLNAAIAVDAQSNVIVSDPINQIIRKITPGGNESILAGITSITGSTNGTGANAQFNSPFGVAVDLEHNVYVADLGNHRIRKITQE